MQGIVKGGLNDGGSNIKSIQYGVKAMANATSDSQAITTVDLTKSIVEISTMNDGSTATPQCQLVRPVLSASSISFVRNTAANNNMSISWTVTEFNNVKNKQSGNTVLSAVDTEQSITVTSVNLSKFKLVGYISHPSATNNIVIMSLKYRMINATTIGVTVLSGGVTPTFSWQLIEFN